MFCLTALFALSVVLSMVSRKNKTLFTERTIMLGEESFTEETLSRSRSPFGLP